jgi:hypothetical protein
MRVLVKSFISFVLILSSISGVRADDSSSTKGPFQDTLDQDKKRSIFGKPFQPFIPANVDGGSASPESMYRRVHIIDMPLHICVSECLSEAASLVENGCFDLAIKALEHTVNKTPRSAEVHYIRGLCAQGKSEFESAKFEFQLAQTNADLQLIKQAQIGFDCANNKSSKLSSDELSFPSEVPWELYPALE